MLSEPLLQRFPNYLKMIFLAMLIIASLLITLIVGLAIAIPVFGTDVLHEIMEMSSDAMFDNIPLQKYLQIVSQIGTFIVPSLLFAFLINRNVSAYLGFNRRPKLYTLIVSTLLILLCMPFVNWLVGINESMQLPEFLRGVERWMQQSEEQAARLTEAFMSDTSISSLVINLVMIGILAAFGEELLFRGVLIRLLSGWFKNIHLAVWIAAIVFSAFHLQFYGFIPRFVLGVVLGYLFVWSGSLWVPVLAHFINNALAVVMMYLYNRNLVNTNLDELGSTESNAVIIFSFVLAAILMFSVYWYENRFTAVKEKV